MKNLSLLFGLCYLILSLSVYSQVAVNEDGTSPNGCAMLDVKSTDKGLLLPRMSEYQRNSISSPVAGLIVWCTNCGDNGELQVYNGNNWTNMVGDPASTVSISIGDFYQGGVVFYMDGMGTGYICAITDQSAGTEWGCMGFEIDGADGTEVGTGEQNTIDIEADCTTSGIAADICANLDMNGYSDWYLPSLYELDAMFWEKSTIDATAIANGGSAFSSGPYWSSTEGGNADMAYRVNFTDGGQFGTAKFDWLNVRAIRTFNY